MGNTNLPQFGAAGTENSRDTLSGKAQLTEPQRNRANASERISGKSPAGSSADNLPNANDPANNPAFGGHANTGYSPSDAT